VTNEPTSAIDAQRRELRLFAAHLLIALHDRAQREMDDATRRHDTGGATAAASAQWFIDRVTVPKIEEMIDNYSPLVNAPAVENELRPLLAMPPTVTPPAARDRISRALRLIAGGER
jgi:hypothetical protein